MDDVNPRLSPLGIVWVVWSAITVLVGVGVFLMAAGFGGLIAVLPDTNTGEPAPWWVGLLFGGMGLAIGGIIAAMGGIGIAVGLALRKGRQWAMIAACILGFMQMSNFPVGTALAIWTFVVVAQEMSRPKA